MVKSGTQNSSDSIAYIVLPIFITIPAIILYIRSKKQMNSGMKIYVSIDLFLLVISLVNIVSYILSFFSFNWKFDYCLNFSDSLALLGIWLGILIAIDLAVDGPWMERAAAHRQSPAPHPKTRFDHPTLPPDGGVEPTADKPIKLYSRNPVIERLVIESNRRVDPMAWLALFLLGFLLGRTPRVFGKHRRSDRT